MNERAERPVIVGADGSGPGYAAVEWAAQEAVRRGLRLRIVSVLPPWLLEPLSEPNADRMRRELRDNGQEVLRQAAARAAAREPRVRTESELVPGSPAQALLKEAEDAPMLVVGGRGLGEFGGLLLGSATNQVALYANCPVVVVRRTEETAYGEIVVAVDDTPSAQKALAFAFEEAGLRSARLRAVHAWHDPASLGWGEMQPPVYDPELVAGEESRVLAEALAGWRSRHPDVEVVEDTVRGGTVRVLSGASARADLLVVGSRGRGGFAGLLLGSVGQAMLHHAHCPVAIAR
ncbi:universal stress protein [Actinocorallia populi]|uniref:universal stress protein n=1 Tax=Actinocorallia populi TaxID=2079200 RepID=UPI000D096415|nr:universal stress protein [Actinocorallia populi]